MEKTNEEVKYLIRLGLNLRKIREEKGWSLEHTEEKGFNSWKFLQRLEKGKHNPTVLTMKRLAKVYQRPLNDLLNFK